MFKLCKEPAQVLRVLLVLQEEPPQGSFVYTRFATRSFLALKNLHKDRGMHKETAQASSCALGSSKL